MPINDRPDIDIRIVADRRRGLWAHKISARSQRAVQVTGRVNAEASRNTLLTVALIAALRGVSRRTIETLQPNPNEKVSIRVATLEPDFGSGVERLMNASSQLDTKQLKVGKNLVAELLRLLQKFDVEIVHEPDHTGLLGMLNWSRNAVLQ